MNHSDCDRRICSRVNNSVIVAYHFPYQICLLENTKILISKGNDSLPGWYVRRVSVVFTVDRISHEKDDVEIDSIRFYSSAPSSADASVQKYFTVIFTFPRLRLMQMKWNKRKNSRKLLLGKYLFKQPMLPLTL